DRPALARLAADGVYYRSPSSPGTVPGTFWRRRMVRSQAWAYRALAFSVTAMLIAACGGPPATTAPQGTGTTPVATGPAATTPGTGPTAGGTIYVLTQAAQFDQVDPQRVYTGEDLAFFGGL